MVAHLTRIGPGRRGCAGAGAVEAIVRRPRGDLRAGMNDSKRSLRCLGPAPASRSRGPRSHLGLRPADRGGVDRAPVLPVGRGPGRLDAPPDDPSSPGSRRRSPTSLRPRPSGRRLPSDQAQADLFLGGLDGGARLEPVELLVRGLLTGGVGFAVREQSIPIGEGRPSPASSADRTLPRPARAPRGDRGGGGRAGPPLEREGAPVLLVVPRTDRGRWHGKECLIRPEGRGPRPRPRARPHHDEVGYLIGVEPESPRVVALFERPDRGPVRALRGRSMDRTYPLPNRRPPDQPLPRRRSDSAPSRSSGRDLATPGGGRPGAAERIAHGLFTSFDGKGRSTWWD